MGNKKNVPAIRFKGFTEEWIKKTLGEFGSVAMNRRVFKDQTDIDGEIPFYKIGTFGGEPDSYISRELFEEYKRKYPYPQIGDILISASGSIGYTVEYKGADEYFQDSNIVWLTHDKRLSNLFLKHLYSIIKWNGLEGSTIKRLYNKNILDTMFMLPNPEHKDKSIEEQTQIGNYFQNTDRLINTSQTKLDKLKSIKKACLEKMFPCNGSNTPELRFNGFTEEWEEEIMARIGIPYNGLSGKTKADFSHGDARFITYMNVFSNPVADLCRTESVEIDNKQNKVQCGDILFTVSSETFDEVGMSSVWLGHENNIYLNSFCFGYRLTTQRDPYYMAYLLRSNSIRKKITFLAQGISRYNISKNRVMEIGLPFPSIGEQKAIGGFFKDLDDLITKTEQQINKLNNIKKACLDKMFVNKED